MTLRSALLGGVAIWGFQSEPLDVGFWSRCFSIVNVYLGARAKLMEMRK